MQAMSRIDPDAEWLEADGLGGFASGKVSGIRTRRYHALLLTATTPPPARGSRHRWRGETTDQRLPRSGTGWRNGIARRARKRCSVVTRKRFVSMSCIVTVAMTDQHRSFEFCELPLAPSLAA